MTNGANAHDPLERTIDRIKSEYREMPGLQLTFEQMLRLWTLDRATCRTLLEKLLDARFLKTTHDGRYVRCEVQRSAPRRVRVF
jgi:hypothetical protein